MSIATSISFCLLFLLLEVWLSCIVLGSQSKSLFIKAKAIQKIWQERTSTKGLTFYYN
jgi:hypothetical protein